MHHNCQYCPPRHFATYTYCHQQRTKIEKNLTKVDENKENIKPWMALNIKIWIERINEFFELCRSESNFIEYGQQLYRFNEIIEIMFQIWEYGETT